MGDGEGCVAHPADHADEHALEGVVTDGVQALPVARFACARVEAERIVWHATSSAEPCVAIDWQELGDGAAESNSKRKLVVARARGGVDVGGEDGEPRACV